jgi:hypothetical protein
MRICAFLFCLAVCSLAFGQDSRADLYGGYSYLNIDTNGLSSRQNANGWEASISGNFNKWFAAEADVSGYYKNYDVAGVSVAVRDYSYLAGPRVNFKPLFFHALIGGDHLSGSVLGVSASQDGLAGAFGGGAQWRFSRRLSLRASADYVFTRHNILGGSSVTQNNVRASVGIIYSFGLKNPNDQGIEQPPSTSHGSRSKSSPSSAPPTHYRGAAVQVAVLGIAVVSGEAGGVEVVEVVRGSVADRSGLQQGDVINGIDGKTIRTPMELAAELSGRADGDKVRVAFMVRGYWQSETTIVLGELK